MPSSLRPWRHRRGKKKGKKKREKISAHLRRSGVANERVQREVFHSGLVGGEKHQYPMTED